jgi:hypothetical protein
MKKGIIAVLFAALIILEAMSAFAGVSPYVDPSTMTSMDSVVRTTTPPLGLIPKIVIPGIGTTQPCKLEMTVSPRDPYFLGRQRNICVQQNKGNLYCQQRCIDRMKLYVATGSFSKDLKLYSASTCVDADPETVKSADSANKCYFVSANECDKVNPSQEFCRRKCMQKAYAICRQNIASMAYSNRK